MLLLSVLRLYLILIYTSTDIELIEAEYKVVEIVVVGRLMRYLLEL